MFETRYLNREINEKDLTFFHEGLKAQYLETIFDKDMINEFDLSVKENIDI